MSEAGWNALFGIACVVCFTGLLAYKIYKTH